MSSDGGHPTTRTDLLDALTVERFTRHQRGPEVPSPTRAEECAIRRAALAQVAAGSFIAHRVRCEGCQQMWWDDAPCPTCLRRRQLRLIVADDAPVHAGEVAG